MPQNNDQKLGKKGTYNEVQIMSDVERDYTIFSFGCVVGCLNL